MTARWRIVLTRTARDQLAAIANRQTRAAIVRRIDHLAEEPERQGTPLVAELAGYRSVRAAGQRFRIIYRVEADHVAVYVVAVGLRRAGDRRDIYALARRLLRQGLLAPDEAEPSGHDASADAGRPDRQ